jgi:hypothetical protein
LRCAALQYFRAIPPGASRSITSRQFGSAQTPVVSPGLFASTAELLLDLTDVEIGRAITYDGAPA